ncbi:MAG: hypothetical protein H6977_19700 [Gammaproteobacteria bacterium]|nr:hypothetical protein [Gammaproteobacteria bacterium]MCP5202227.1 hypothetical protein [Gammaproteobacteria bacterium]
MTKGLSLGIDSRRPDYWLDLGSAANGFEHVIDLESGKLVSRPIVTALFDWKRTQTTWWHEVSVVHVATGIRNSYFAISLLKPDLWRFEHAIRGANIEAEAIFFEALPAAEDADQDEQPHIGRYKVSLESGEAAAAAAAWVILSSPFEDEIHFSGREYELEAKWLRTDDIAREAIVNIRTSANSRALRCARMPVMPMLEIERMHEERRT